jgi:hypothetical protein
MRHRSPALDGKAWWQGAAVWLLLLSIFTHAVVPAGSPLHRTPGSAFSATTAEVAIAPKRKSADTEQAQPGSGDEGGSQGSGASDDPPAALQAHSAFASPFHASEPRHRLAFASLRADGGAASFSARAPPAL